MSFKENIIYLCTVRTVPLIILPIQEKCSEKENTVTYERNSKRETQTNTKATGNRHIELEKHKGWKIIVLEVNLTLITEYFQERMG